MALISALFALLAASVAVEQRTALSCANDCPLEEDSTAERYSARLLQQTVQLVSSPEDKKDPRDAKGGRPRVGMHYMMLLRLGDSEKQQRAADAYVETVLALDTCFAEILLTLDHSVKRPGDDVNARHKFPGAALSLLNRSSSDAQFFCDLKERTRHLKRTLSERCGFEVATQVQVLDPSLPHVQEASFLLFGSRELPRRMFKNTHAYMYGPAVMGADYIVHVDDDVTVSRKTGQSFVDQALQVFEQSNVVSVNMPCCNCPEHQKMTEFLDSRQPKFSGLVVGQMTFSNPDPHNQWKTAGFDEFSRCTVSHNFICMQAYILHAARFRSLLPVRVNNFTRPGELQIECMLTEAAKAATPPAIFGWIGAGAGHCRSLRKKNEVPKHFDIPLSPAGRQCLASAAEDAAAKP